MGTFWKCKGSTILAFVGAAGVVATGVLAAKETPKAMRILKEAEEEKGEALTKVEVVKTVAPAYIPAVVTGAATIVCIFGINSLSKKQQASIASAYALLDSSYKEYRNKVNAIYGDDADDRVKDEIARDKCEDAEPSTDDNVKLFLDFNTLEYFEAPFDKVVQKATMGDGLECYIIDMPSNRF